MLNNMLNKINKKLTNNYNSIPLFWVSFNLNEYLEYGKKNSCVVKIHPVLNEDEYVIDTLNKLVDYIRNEYDMELLSK